MVENRYVEGIHENPLFCPDDACGVKNAPPGSDEYKDNCWRCDTALRDDKVSEGDVLEVTVVDEKPDGTTVARSESGLVIFVHEDVHQPIFPVEVTDVDRNYASATVTDASDLPDDGDSEEENEQPHRLGSRENFWDN